MWIGIELYVLFLLRHRASVERHQNRMGWFAAAFSAVWGVTVIMLAGAVAVQDHLAVVWSHRSQRWESLVVLVCISVGTMLLGIAAGLARWAWSIGAWSPRAADPAH